MNTKEIQDLLKLVNKLELSEFKLEQGDLKLSIRTKQYVKAMSTSNVMMSSPQHAVQVQGPAAPAPAAAPAAPVIDLVPEAPAADSTEGLLEVKSPMVGTFYRSASPDKPPYVKVGDNIDAGSTVCIVEAMKLFNEIESEISGKIVKVLIEDASPVEYDQVLFLVDPKG